MKVYIASSWKNQHAVEMLTALLRERNHEASKRVPGEPVAVGDIEARE